MPGDSMGADEREGRALKARMMTAWLVCLAPLLTLGVPLAFTSNPPSPYGLVAIVSILSCPLLLIRAYKAYTAWAAHDSTTRAAASKAGYEARYLPRRREQLPELETAPEPRLREWLPRETFRKFDTDVWRASRPFAGVVDGMPVAGVTARLTSRYTTHERHRDQTGRGRTTHFDEFTGLALRTETGRAIESPTMLFPLRNGWLSGPWDRFMHAEPSRYGRRIPSGDTGFDTRSAMHGETPGTLLSSHGRALIDRLATRHGAVTVSWRGREIVMAVACGIDWDTSERGVELLRDAVETLAELRATLS